MDYTKYVDKFYGPDKIKFVELLEEKTYNKKDLLKLTFQNDEQQIIPAEVATYAITDETKDLTALRELLVDPIAKQFIEILLESQLKIEDMEYVLSKARGSIQQSISKAMDKLWGKEASKLTLTDVDKILTKKT